MTEDTRIMSDAEMDAIEAETETYLAAGRARPADPELERRIAADARSLLSAKSPANQEHLRAASPLRRHGSFLAPFGPVPAGWVRAREGLWVLTEGGAPVVVVPGEDERAKPSYEAFVSVFGVPDRLGDISTPTLVVAGGQDLWVPLAGCERLQAGIPDAELVILEETGHGVEDLESADAGRYRAALRRFLSGCR